MKYRSVCRAYEQLQTLSPSLRTISNGPEAAPVKTKTASIAFPMGWDEARAAAIPVEPAAAAQAVLRRARVAGVWRRWSGVQVP